MKKTFGMMIAELRKEHGMTQSELKKGESASQKSPREIINLVIKAVALAMGVAVVVLSVLDSLAVESGMVLLGIGMTCTGISLFNSKE